MCVKIIIRLTTIIKNNINLIKIDDASLYIVIISNNNMTTMMLIL